MYFKASTISLASAFNWALSKASTSTFQLTGTPLPANHRRNISRLIASVFPLAFSVMVSIITPWSSLRRYVPTSEFLAPILWEIRTGFPPSSRSRIVSWFIVGFSFMCGKFLNDALSPAPRCDIFVAESLVITAGHTILSPWLKSSYHTTCILVPHGIQALANPTHSDFDDL